MLNGTIKSFLADKGFGFIKPANGSDDMFFHSSAVEGGELADLVRGRPVTYEVGDKRGKPQAMKVAVLPPVKRSMPIQDPLLARLKVTVATEELSELEAFEKEWGLRPSR